MSSPMVGEHLSVGWAIDANIFRQRVRKCAGNKGRHRTTASGEV